MVEIRFDRSWHASPIQNTYAAVPELAILCKTTIDIHPFGHRCTGSAWSPLEARGSSSASKSSGFGRAGGRDVSCRQDVIHMDEILPGSGRGFCTAQGTLCIAPAQSFGGAGAFDYPRKGQIHMDRFLTRGRRSAAKPPLTCARPARRCAGSPSGAMRGRVNAGLTTRREVRNQVFANPTSKATRTRAEQLRACRREPPARKPNDKGPTAGSPSCAS